MDKRILGFVSPMHNGAYIPAEQVLIASGPNRGRAFKDLSEGCESGVQLGTRLPGATGLTLIGSFGSCTAVCDLETHIARLGRRVPA